MKKKKEIRSHNNLRIKKKKKKENKNITQTNYRK